MGMERRRAVGPTRRGGKAHPLLIEVIIDE